MAQSISLSSGSVFNGNPIVVDVTPYAVPAASGTPSVHRIVLEIECGMSGGNFETVKMSSPVLSETGDRTQSIDISSALRMFRDSYSYSPDAATYPIVKFNIKYYDEYVIDGDFHATASMYYPKNPWVSSDVPGYEEELVRDDSAYMRTIFGAFSDMERLSSGLTRYVKELTRKPKTLPEIVAIGETYAYTPDYTEETKRTILESGGVYDIVTKEEVKSPLSQPVSTIKTISASDLGEGKTEGALTLGGHSLYALPASKAAERQVFRFINGFGVLESVSVPRVYKKQVNITSTPYVIARQETFNKFSRSTVRKTNNREAWMYSTDPMDEAWMSWYIHEFLMAEHVWMGINGTWVACTITPEEETTLRDDTERTMYSLAFSVKLDINGSPIL